MKKIVIASACRTAIGKFGGTLAVQTSSPSRSIMFTWAASSRLVWARTSLVRLP